MGLTIKFAFESSVGTQFQHTITLFASKTTLVAYKVVGYQLLAVVNDR